tara:strand:+ start:1254 stop:1397 length:144 start_codon:yes stop_codon:yes gene_type:complete
MSVKNEIEKLKGVGKEYEMTLISNSTKNKMFANHSAASKQINFKILR